MTRHVLRTRIGPVTLYRDARGKWRWRLRSRNGKLTDASSQGFATRWSAKRNIITTARGLAAAVAAL